MLVGKTIKELRSRPWKSKPAEPTLLRIEDPHKVKIARLTEYISEQGYQSPNKSNKIEVLKVCIHLNAFANDLRTGLPAWEGFVWQVHSSFRLLLSKRNEKGITAGQSNSLLDKVGEDIGFEVALLFAGVPRK